MRGFRVLVVLVLAAVVGVLAWNARSSRPSAVERVQPNTEVAAAPEEPARLDEQEPAPSRATLVSKEPDAEITPDTMPAALVLNGTCTAADGSRLPDNTAYVWYRDDSGVQQKQAHVLFGAWSIDGLMPGRGTLAGYADGYLPQRIELRLRADVPVQRFDLKLEYTGIVRVRFETPEGQSLQEAEWKGIRPRLRAIATREDPSGHRFDSIWADETLSPLARWEDWNLNRAHEHGGEDSGFDGALVFVQPLPAYVSAVMRSIVLESKRVSPGTHELVFTISVDRLRDTLGSVRGRIVDGDSGIPLADAALGFWDLTSMSTGKKSEPDGTFLWEHVEPGLHRLTVQFKGHELLQREIVVEPGHVLDLGDVRLDAAVSLRVRIVDADGNGVETKVHVKDFASLGNAKSSEENLYFQCDATGHLDHAMLGRRQYLVRVDNDEWSARPVAADLSKGPIDELVIHATHPTRVLIRPTAPLDWDEWIAIDDDDNLRVLDRRLYDTMRFAVRLVPGNYTLRHLRGEKLLGERALAVGTELLEIDLP